MYAIRSYYAESNVEEADVVTEEISPVAEKINKIKKIDPSFNQQQFLDGAKLAFEMIVKSFASADHETLKNLLNPKMFDGFKKVIDGRAERGEKAECELVGFESVEIQDISLMGTVADVITSYSIHYTKLYDFNNIYLFTNKTHANICDSPH